MTTILAIFFPVVILPVVYHYLVAYKRRSANIPPGPRPIPVFGNLFDLPKKEPWMAYRAWSTTYGGVRYQHIYYETLTTTAGSNLIFLDLPNQPTLIVNSLSAAMELMDKRSKNFSDKPAMVMDVLYVQSVPC